MPSRTSGCGGAALDDHEGGQQADREREAGDRLGALQPVVGRLDDRAHEQQHARRSAAARPGGRSGAWRRGTGRSGDVARDHEQQQRGDRARGAGTSSASRRSVSRPPNTSPNENPLAPNALKIASALLRAGPFGEGGGDERERRGDGERGGRRP